MIEQQKILEAIQPLDQFVKTTPQPFGWFVQWQGIYQQVVKRIQALAAEKGAPTDGNGQAIG